MGRCEFLFLSCDIRFSLTHARFFPQVINDHGVPGTENEEDEPTGSQVELFSRL
jgi:hypothetical protein